MNDYQQILRDEFDVRCRTNATNSLRAVARHLGVNPARLSEILNGRTGLSGELAQKFAKKLGFNAHESNLFLALVESQHARSKKAKSEAKKRLAEFREQNAQVGSVTLDSFRLISDWYHYGLLELTRLQDFKRDPAWIGRKLGIPKTTVDSAIERLKRLEFLQEKDGTLVASDDFYFTPSGIPSDALKKFHSQVLEKASRAIHLQSVDERDFSAIVMAIDERDLPRAKEEIKAFRRKFSASLERSRNKTAVYGLAIQFYRMDEK